MLKIKAKSFKNLHFCKLSYFHHKSKIHFTNTLFEKCNNRGSPTIKKAPPVGGAKKFGHGTGNKIRTIPRRTSP